MTMRAALLEEFSGPTDTLAGIATRPPDLLKPTSQGKIYIRPGD